MPENKNNTSQKEFEIVTPERKNEDITTTEPGKNYRGEQTQKEQPEGGSEKKEDKPAGFDIEDTKKESQQQNENDKPKRIDNDKEREERENPDSPTYQDAEWQQDKLNEANNEDEGTPVKEGTPVDEKGKPNDRASKGVSKEAAVSDKEHGKERGSFGDTRLDSITERPKTETYENTLFTESSKALTEANYLHTREEAKRKSLFQNVMQGSSKSRPGSRSWGQDFQR